MSTMVFLAVTWPPAWSVLYGSLMRKFGSSGHPYALAWTWGGLGMLIGYSYAGYWLPAVIAAGQVVIGLAIWWWRRRKRRNVLALMGQKSRLLRDALVRRVREVTKPSPVLRPQRSPA